MKIVKTKAYSYKSGKLADGCKMCIKGQKLVLFVTGLCAQRCSFCPVSDQKIYQDVIYANERPIKKESDINQIISEIKISRANGAGITGGDPLVKINRTILFIKRLKKEFGKDFHIHLYTPLILVNSNILKKLYDAGLDEIRFHPELHKEQEWERLILARKYPWKIGVEIPIVPGTYDKLKKLVLFLKGKIDFLNLNELEMTDNHVWRKVKNIENKDNLSYAIKGSEELAKKIIALSSKMKIRTHYCTVKLKDRVQLATRVLRRSKNTKLATDIVDEEGMLYRGAIYLNQIKPDFGYRDKLNSLKETDRENILFDLNELTKHISKEFKIPDKKLFVDDNKLRIITSTNIVDGIKNKKRTFKKAYSIAKILEYPTFDATELEVEYL